MSNRTHKRKGNNNSRKNSSSRQKHFVTKSLSARGIINKIKKSISSVQDDRLHSKNFKYELADIAIAIIIGIIRKSLDFNSIHTFMVENIQFLHRYGLFINPEAGSKVPSKATIYRLVKKIDANQFQKAFIDFILSLNVKTSIGKLNVIAVDGKRMNGTKCGQAGRPLNILTAFNSILKLPVFCEACDVKSNEIKAWDNLLDGLKGKLEEFVFTADAMGCQKKILTKIKDMKNHYCLAVKGNQGNLEKDCEILVKFSKPVDNYTEPRQLGHGRIEWRECYTFHAADRRNCSYIMDIDKWADLKTVILVRSHRINKKTGEENKIEERLYISDLEESAEEFNSIIRRHWGVEVLHWVFDVDFKQDSIKRTNDIDSTASKNLDTLQKFAYAILTLFEMSNESRNKDYKPKGTMALMTRANANNYFLSELLDVEIKTVC